MAKTLLAVDDSVTMRKVLEITFSGEDFRVVTADTTQGALGKLSENPQVCVIDTMLGAEDGYSLAKELRKKSPSTSIIMLASRYAPYDQARGRDAGADDWADKPFDTQQLIDKVRKVMLAKEAGGAAVSPAAAAAAQQSPYRTPASVHHPPVSATAVSPGSAAADRPVTPGLSRGTQPSLGGSVPRAGALGSLGGDAAASRPEPRPASVVAAAPPVQSQASPPSMSKSTGGAVAPAMQQVSGSVNGQLEGKLGELGLTPQQAQAVLALSREVVERVVWEVVPQLAEAIIKEEIARLTK